MGVALANSQSGKYIPLNAQPSYDSFIALLTDGDDLELSSCLESKTYGDGVTWTSGFCFQQPRLESDIFRNQSACSNGIDLEGSLIKKISLRVHEESIFRPERNRTEKQSVQFHSLI